MKRAALRTPDTLKRLLQAAEAAREDNDYERCIETLQKARRLAPANTEILLQLGRMHGLRYDYAAAERYFDQTLRLAPREAEMLHVIADRCFDFRNPELAERFLLRALERPDSATHARIQLAQLYRRLRRLPEAAQLVDQVLASDPAYPYALLTRAQMERLAGRLESAEEALRSFIDKPQPITWGQVQGWYELAAVLDRQGKYEEAMTACLRAKALQRPRADATPDVQKRSYAGYKVMGATITAEMLRRWHENREALSPARPLALLCGYARSGTTLLEQVLDTHPDIVSAEETITFMTDVLAPLRRTSPRADMLPLLETAGVPALQQARAGYFRFMELSIGSPIGNRLLLDKNPMFTAFIPAYVRTFPETKFLIALRDPRDVVVSRFMQAMPIQPVTKVFQTLEGTVEDYSELMGLWLKLKPMMPVPCLEVRYEDVVADLESVARKTLNFLERPWQGGVLEFDEHARKKAVLSPTSADVTQPVYKRAVGRWRNYQKYLEPHLARLEPFVKAFGYE